MDFSYLAVDKTGQKQKGKLEANDQKEVVDFIRSRELTPLSIKSLEKNNSSLFNYFSKVKANDIVIFTRQLSSMILTGLTLIESLTILKQQNDNPQMQKIVNDLIAKVSEGQTFSQALSEHKDVFSDVYIALIRAAEEGGLLDKVLSRLADNLEKSEEVKKKVKSALFYPGIIVSGVLIVLTMMNVFVIPQMGELYKSLNLSLPPITRFVLFMSKLTTTFLPFTILFLAGAGLLLHRFKKTPTGIRAMDKIRIKAPVFGEIAKLSAFDEITRTLSLLISSGSSLIGAIAIAADVSGNIFYKEALNATGQLVEKGVGLSAALQNQDIFPPVMIQMVKVGESTGKIDESFLKVSEYFERDLEMRVKTLTTAIEPILIIVLGISVAFLIISVITPIYSLVSQIQ